MPKPLEEKQMEAKRRNLIYSELTPEQKLGVIKSRPGASKKEVKKIEGFINAKKGK